MEEIMQMLAAMPPEARLETVQQAFEDKARFDKLQALTERNTHTGTVRMRFDDEYGWTLAETSQPGADSDVRGAIDRFFAELDPEGEMLA